MSKSIFQNFPEAKQLLGLRTEELAGYLLEHFHSLSLGQQQQAMAHNLANDISSRYRARKEDIYRAISTACQWLINKGFLVPIGPQGVLELTGEGNQTKTATALRAYLGAEPEPSALLASQDFNNSTETKPTIPINLEHANGLYEKAKRLIHETERLDQNTAKIIVESADDAIKEFGTTNQEKKVELKGWKKEAESVLPPDTIEELRKRAEAKLIGKTYPGSEPRRNFVLWVIGIGVVAVILISVYWTLFPRKEGQSAAETNPTNKLNASPTPTTYLSPAPASPLPSPGQTKISSPDERARQLKQEGERLMNAGKYNEAKIKFNKALKITGISVDLESQLRKLRIRAETMDSQKELSHESA